MTARLRYAIQPGDGDRRHGTVNGYNNLNCRCDECRAAWAADVADARQRRRARLDDTPHGTASGRKNWGCHCDKCRAAAGVDVEAERRREQVRDLVCRGDMTAAEIAARTGETPRNIYGWFFRLGIPAPSPEPFEPTAELLALADYADLAGMPGRGRSERDRQRVQERGELIRAVSDQGYYDQTIADAAGLSRERVRQIRTLGTRDGRRAEAAKLYRRGLTARQVAARIGVGERTVRAWLDGQLRRTGPRGNTKITDDEIVRLHDEEGLGWIAIAGKVGMSRSGVRNRYRVATGQQRSR